MVGLKDFNMPSCCNSCGHWSFSNDDEPLCDLTYEYISQFDKKQDDCPLVEAIPKADYEARLKADMVAMLKELQLEIEGQCKIPNNCASAYDWNKGVYACYKAVQSKIDKLKENTDGNR